MQDDDKHDQWDGALDEPEPDFLPYDPFDGDPGPYSDDPYPMGYEQGIADGTWQQEHAQWVREQSRPRPAPQGMNRRERRDWKVSEARRIADLQNRELPAGRVGITMRPPHRLGRNGRNAWREVHSGHVQERVRAEYKRTATDRQAGALVVAAIIGTALVLRLFVFNGSDDPAPDPAAPAVTPVYQTTTQPVVDENGIDAAQAVLAWFTATCGSSDDYPQPRRLIDNAPRMTAEAWEQIDQSNPAMPAEWWCTEIDGAAVHVSDTRYLVRYHGLRTITNAGTLAVYEARFAERQPDGSWLVGLPPGAAD